MKILLSDMSTAVAITVLQAPSGSIGVSDEEANGVSNRFIRLMDLLDTPRHGSDKRRV